MYAQKLQRTMHFRVCPSTLQVMVVVPRPTGRTTPSAEMVATEVSTMLQLGAEEVPFTFIYTAGSLLLEKVKSVLFRERAVLVPPAEDAAPLVTEL